MLMCQFQRNNVTIRKSNRANAFFLNVNIQLQSDYSQLDENVNNNDETKNDSIDPVSE